MGDLTTRFLGLGSDRLKRTIELSNGLATPASKFTSRVQTVKPFFPQGRWTEGKTPKVSKKKVGHLSQASIGEVVSTDTFESGDSRYQYGQAYFDLASHWGDVFPMRSRNDVGTTFADFCCRNWVPLYLVRDNIGENIGGSLLEECRKRNVRSAFICPRHPQQNYAEGYLGRVTAMASFAMVFAGAPLFMWIFAIRTAVFISNISASYYSLQGIWSTPYTLIHGEPFPDASVVVPFGCAVLVLRDSDDRAKFRNRAVMMIFVHYSDDHPLFTYAVYSPRTKRVLHRQDVIFLTSVFPMRSARVASGLGPDGDTLTVVRSPPSVLQSCPSELSFGDWCTPDSLPDYDDDVSGFVLSQPYESLLEVPEELEGVPVYNPQHPSFPPSSVLVPIPAASSLSSDRSTPLPSGVAPEPDVRFQATPLEQSDDFEPMGGARCEEQSEEFRLKEGPVARDSAAPPLRRSGRSRVPVVRSSVPRRLVKDHWYYEPVLPAAGTVALLTVPDLQPSSGRANTSVSEVPGPTAPVHPGVLPLSPTFLVTGVSDSGDPPLQGSPLLLSDESTGRFQIHLCFPNEELPNQPFMVTASMTVPFLEIAIARLMQISPPLSMFVAPHWELLDHPGLIVDRFLSDMITSCPYLQPDSILRVLSRRSPPLDERRAVVRMALDRLNTSSVGGRSSPHELVFGLPAPLPLALLDFPSSSALDVAPAFDSSPRLTFDSDRPLAASDTIVLHASSGLVPSSSSSPVAPHLSPLATLHADRGALGGVSELSRHRDDGVVNLQRNGENIRENLPRDGENHGDELHRDGVNRVSSGLPITDDTDNVEWGQPYGPLASDPNFAPTPWRRFEWNGSENTQGPELEPTSWGRSRPKRSPSSSSSSFGDRRSSSGSVDSHGVLSQLRDGEKTGSAILRLTPVWNSRKSLQPASRWMMAHRTRTPSLSQNAFVRESTRRMFLFFTMECRIRQFVLASLATNEAYLSKGFGGSKEWNVDGIEDW
jgi:hypothetical protein